MRIVSTALLAGVASVALAGAVMAQGLPTHVMNVPLPDGGAIQIHYTGNVAPRVAIVPGASEAALFPAAFWADDPGFARMERISALMDRQADILLQQAAALMARPFPMTAGPGDAMRIDTAALPPGARSYTFSETLGPNGVCRQSMAIAPAVPGEKPHVVTRQSGNCGSPENSVAVPDRVPDMTPARAPGTLRVKATPAGSPSHYVREAAYRPRY